MRDPTFVLLRNPIELVRANCLELVELGKKNSQIKIMSKVYPGNHEEAKVGAHERVIEVVECFGGLERTKH
jgi:hypothetical protein